MTECLLFSYPDHCTFPSATHRPYTYIPPPFTFLIQRYLSDRYPERLSKKHSLPGSFNHFGIFTVPVADPNVDGLDEGPGVEEADAVFDSGSGGIGRSSARSKTKGSSGAGTVTSRQQSGFARNIKYMRAYDSTTLPEI